MEILIAIIKALFGLENAETPPPRPRRLRQSAGGDLNAEEERGRVSDADPDRQASLNDIFRQLFGGVPDVVEEEGEILPSVPPPVQPESPDKRRRRQTVVVKTAPQGDGYVAASEPLVAPVLAKISVAVDPAPTAAGISGQKAAFNGEKPAKRLPAIAGRLRGNPSALREAFVFSEIFGRPLAEGRRDGR